MLSSMPTFSEFEGKRYSHNTSTSCTFPTRFIGWTGLTISLPSILNLSVFLNPWFIQIEILIIILGAIIAAILANKVDLM